MATDFVFCLDLYVSLIIGILLISSLYTQQSSCSFTQSGLGATMSGSISIASGSESDLQSAVANMGPIAVAVDASSNAFRVCLRVPFHNLECTHTQA